MSTTPSEISALVSLISSAASAVESYYQADKTKPHAPSLDETEAHPLDQFAYPPDVRRSLQILEGACMQLSMVAAPPGHTMLNKIMRIFEPTCVGVALRAGLADILLDAPSGMHVSEISKRCGVEKGKLGRVLRLLCSCHIFLEVSRDVFANNRLSMQLLKSNPISDMAWFWTEEYTTTAAFSMASNLLDPESGHSYAVQDSCFNRTSGYPHSIYEYFEGKDDPKGKERGARFSRAMIGWNIGVNNIGDVLSTDFPWDKLPDGTIVNDVGGGNGGIARRLCKRYPHLRLKLQDLPERIEEAKNEIWPQEYPEGLSEGRVEFKGMDFLKESPIPNCDIYLLKNVIHNWPDNEAIKILSNVRAAMGPSSRVMVYEYIIQGAHRSPDNESDTKQAPSPVLPNYGAGRIRQYNLDLINLVLFGSKVRGLDGYIELGRAAGLQFVKIWDLGEMGLIEFKL